MRQTCTSGQCKKKNGQPCSSNSGCESTTCRENTSMRTCGGGDCKDYQCNQTPPAQDTCDVHDP